MHAEKSIEMLMPSELLKIFYPLLQQGVTVEVEAGCSIKKMLTEQFGIAAEYISSRITTLFLNNKAVDDASTALVADGSVIALSGAMPGLVGATMRSGGFYAAMRSAMSFRCEGIPEAKRGNITMKMFNLLLEELGPRILMRGIRLRGSQFKTILNAQPDLRLRGCCVDGQVFSGDFKSLAQIISSDDLIVDLKVRFGD